MLLLYFSELDTHERPRVIDMGSGVKAAGHSILNGWKDGLTGFVRKPRIGYHRHGILGAVTGAAVATANGFIKPTVGSLASVTWLSRGIYASIRQNSQNRGKTKANGLINTSPVQLSPKSDGKQRFDSDENTPTSIKFAAVVSGYSTNVCQDILNEFEKVKQRHKATAATTPTQTRVHRSRHLFRRSQRHSNVPHRSRD